MCSRQDSLRGSGGEGGDAEPEGLRAGIGAPHDEGSAPHGVVVGSGVGVAGEGVRGLGVRVVQVHRVPAGVSPKRAGVDDVEVGAPELFVDAVDAVALNRPRHQDGAATRVDDQGRDDVAHDRRGRG